MQSINTERASLMQIIPHQKTSRSCYAVIHKTKRIASLKLNQVIPCCFSVSGLDVIAQAQSGTGKTATFSISILQQIDVDIKQVQALVLAPTRELAQQVQSLVFFNLSNPKNLERLVRLVSSLDCEFYVCRFKKWSLHLEITWGPNAMLVLVAPMWVKTR